jgi:hypothetical protein
LQQHCLWRIGRYVDHSRKQKWQCHAGRSLESGEAAVRKVRQKKPSPLKRLTYAPRLPRLEKVLSFFADIRLFALAQDSVDETVGKPPQAIAPDTGAKELPRFGILLDAAQAITNFRNELSTKTGR